ncbi:MAG: cupin domain-containing protein [Hyphomonadaceae bacterium]|nr:cupin domain-containing protein [Hyphomonadaceae bacterium]
MARKSAQKPVKAGARKAKKASPKKASAAKAHVLKGADMARLQMTFAHPLNPNSEVSGVRMGAHLGLKRTGVNFIRIAAGREAYVPHAHQLEEEWVYILYGQGEALIGTEWVAVGAGDFLAYPAPQIVHHLRNAGFEDLVCLMGGESLAFDVVDYPTVARRSVRIGATRTLFDPKTAQVLTPPKPKRK